MLCLSGNSLEMLLLWTNNNKCVCRGTHVSVCTDGADVPHRFGSVKLNDVEHTHVHIHPFTLVFLSYVMWFCFSSSPLCLWKVAGRERRLTWTRVSARHYACDVWESTNAVHSSLYAFLLWQASLSYAVSLTFYVTSVLFEFIFIAGSKYSGASCSWCWTGIATAAKRRAVTQCTERSRAEITVMSRCVCVYIIIVVFSRLD